MDVSLHTKLSADEEYSLKEYLRVALTHEQYGGRWPLGANRVAMYIDQKAYIPYTGNTSWQLSDPYIYIGRTYLGDVEKGKVLAILITLTQLLPEDAEVNGWVSKALSQYLIEEFNQLRKGLITAEIPAKGLAFTKDNQLAALLEDTWYLGNGVEVDVSGDEWTRCKL